MDTDVVHVIANPEAQGGGGRKALRKLARRLEGAGVSARIHETTAPGDATRWAADFPPDAADGPIVVVGGDGTLHEVANGLLAADPAVRRRAIAILPMGTGNDFHRMLRAGGDADEVLHLLEHGEERVFDVGRVRFEGGERHFVNLLGVGIDVAILRRRGRFRLLPGILQYLAALLASLVRFRPVPTVVEYVDARGETHRLAGRTLLTAVTVGPCVGGGFRLAPRARPDDGVLDLFQVERLSPIEIMRILPRVIRGTQREGPRLHLRTLRTARVHRADGEPLDFELDGEVMNEKTTWLEIDLVPDALTFLDRAESDT